MKHDETFERRLLGAARRAMRNAWAPYSKTSVGAALLDAKGRVFAGASVQNASSALNTCAEQAALSAAVTAGARRFTAIAVVRSRGGACVPCGRCLQLLSEFASDLVILSADGKRRSEWRLKDLLPVPYRRPAEERRSRAK